MKKILLLTIVSFISVRCFGQDNPYSLFGYKLKVEYKTNKTDIYRVKNANALSKVKFIEFDREHKTVQLLDSKDSVLQKMDVTNDNLLRWTSTDPLADKYPSLSPYNYTKNNPIGNIDPDGRVVYPVVTVTNEVIGTAQQRVLGYSNELSNPSKYATTTVNVYKVVVTDTEDKNYRMEFGATRDAFAVTKGAYSDAYKANGDGDGPRTAVNVAFDPAKGGDNTFGAQQKDGGYPSGAAAAMYLINDAGGTSLPSAPRPGAVAMGFTKDANAADGVMFHVGGYYTGASGKTNLAASEACFGIVNPGNSPTNPSNGLTNTVVNSIVGQANKSVTNPGLIQVVVDPRNKVPASRTVTP